MASYAVDHQKYVFHTLMYLNMNVLKMCKWPLVGQMDRCVSKHHIPVAETWVSPYSGFGKPDHAFWSEWLDWSVQTFDSGPLLNVIALPLSPCFLSVSLLSLPNHTGGVHESQKLKLLSPHTFDVNWSVQKCQETSWDTDVKDMQCNTNLDTKNHSPQASFMIYKWWKGAVLWATLNNHTE